MALPPATKVVMQVAVTRHHLFVVFFFLFVVGEKTYCSFIFAIRTQCPVSCPDMRNKTRKAAYPAILAVYLAESPVQPT
jgi:hypothetical protein